jgi:hypothetical protein
MCGAILQTIVWGGGTRHIKLAPNFWPDNRRISGFDSTLLIKPFSMEEIKHAIFETKKEAAPGPNGYGAGFFSTLLGKDQRQLFQFFC